MICFRTLNMQRICCSREAPICKKEDPSACEERESRIVIEIIMGWKAMATKNTNCLSTVLFSRYANRLPLHILFTEWVHVPSVQKLNTIKDSNKVSWGEQQTHRSKLMKSFQIYSYAASHFSSTFNIVIIVEFIRMKLYHYKEITL